MERGAGGYQAPSKMCRRSTMGICLQLVTSKFWSFLHESMIAKTPFAEMGVSNTGGENRSNYNLTGELGRSNPEGF